MTPEPSPCWVSSCTTAGSSALATAATGSSPALICEGVTLTGMPGAEALALLEPRSRSCPRPKPAPTSSTTARAPATRREEPRRGGRSPLVGAGPPQDGPVPDGSGTGPVSAWPHGVAGRAEPQPGCCSVAVPAAPGPGTGPGPGPGAPAAGPDGPPPGPAALQPVPAPPWPQPVGAAPQLGPSSRLQGGPASCRPPSASGPRSGGACSWLEPPPGGVVASPAAPVCSVGCSSVGSWVPLAGVALGCQVSKLDIDRAS